jgi:pyrimidine operon attenuation protein / uracil phosphoribosyltransferase
MKRAVREDGPFLFWGPFLLFLGRMEGTTEKVKILSAGAIVAMLRRMAYQIYERNFAEPKLFIAGIGARGGFIADRLEASLKEISPIAIQRVDLVKQEGHELAWVDVAVAEEMSGQSLLIVDDVLYSGATVLQALVLAAGLNPGRIQTAFLIDRGHHQYPLTHDYVGMEMATSLKQYISVEVDAVTQRAEAFIY